MTLKSVIRFGLTAALLSNTLVTLATVATDPTDPPIAKNLEIQTDTIYDPDHLSLASIQTYSKNFTFDWNHYSTIETNKKKVEEIEAFLKTTPLDAYAKLNTPDQRALGTLLYKLGTYYTHVTRQPDQAIEIMELANTLITNKEEKAWNYNHLAYAYEQKYAAADDNADHEKVLFYTDKVITKLYHNAKNKQVAFAFCVEGLVQDDAGEFTQAEDSFKTALRMYETIPNGKDEQYARAKENLATILLDQDGHDQEAIAMLEESKHYWETKDNYNHNPYAARNLISLGEAYFKVGKAQDARDQFTKALAIYQTFYGHDNRLLIEPYQLLSDSYQKLGDEKLAKTYEKMADALDNTDV